MTTTTETPKENEPAELAQGMLEAIKTTETEGDGQAPEPQAPTEPPEGMPNVNSEPKADEPKPDGISVEKTDEAANAEIEAEMDSLGLKERSRARFQSLSRENNELRPIKAALEAAGIKDVADIPSLIERAEAGEVFQDAIKATGAPPSDFGRALDILADMNSGDPVRQMRGLDALNEVVKHWSPILGREAEGVDPFTNHPDLAEAVESGEITRAHALELAQSRSVQRLQEASVQQRQQQTQAEQAQQQAEQTARSQLTDLGNQLAAQDPHYAAKFPSLKAALISIMENTPPERWAAAAARAYQALPNPTVQAPASTTPTHRPLRANAIRESVVPEFTDPFQALMAGIKVANGEVT
jgi:hypothetical protein